MFLKLANKKRTLFQSDLERQFPQYDRVTMYRTLLSFLEAGVAHRIPNETGVASYVMAFAMILVRRISIITIIFILNVTTVVK